MKQKNMDNWILLMRLSMGWVFFYAGLSKIIKEGGWTAAGYLANLEGPFAEIFAQMAGNSLVDWLNMLGLLAVGIAFILGIGIHIASFSGIILMLLYFFAEYPARGDYMNFIEDHIIYAIVFLGFYIFGAGKKFSLGEKFKKESWYKNSSWLH